MPGTVPRHIAIIMDGNGRWAEQRGLSRLEGHKAGAEAARRAIEACGELNVPFVTLFGFSSENWNRPADEVLGLMNLLRYYLKKETAELHKKGARLKVIGDRARLSDDICQLIDQAEDITKDNNKMTVQVALSYSGRQDIVQAVERMLHDYKTGDVVDEKHLEKYLHTSGIPDPDLMIRTSGEYRISNFLLWQMAYTELFFTPTYWPDFSKKDFEEAIAFYQSRERRFGGLPAKNQQGVV